MPTPRSAATAPGADPAAPPPGLPLPASVTVPPAAATADSGRAVPRPRPRPRALEDAAEKELAHDDGSGDLNAQIIFEAPKDGMYRIVASFGGSQPRS
jgi:hypothetical protein